MKRSSSSVSNQIQLLVDRATGSSQSSVDPNLSASIVQFAKSSDDAPKEVARALRKRLNAVSSARDFRSAELCLDLLEACVQSCGARFHTQLAGKRDLLDELVRLIGPKYSPPPELQDRVLLLLLTWSESFKDRPDLREIDRVIRELRGKGVQFPDPNYTYESLQTYANVAGGVDTGGGATAAPVTRSHPAPQLRQRPASTLGGQAQNRLSQQPQQQQQQQQLTPQQVNKLRADVNQVCTNSRIFNELLTEAANGKATTEDIELMRQLNIVNRKMQQRLMELLGGQLSSHESVINELLHINDELNSAFLRFDRFENSRPPPQPRSTESTAAPQQQPVSSIYPTVSSATDGVNLIDLSDDGPPPPPRAAAVAGTAATSGNPGNLPDSEAELREMESWMRSEGMIDNSGANNASSIDRNRFEL